MMPGSLCAAADYLNKHPDCMWLTGDTVYFDVHGIIQRCLYGPYWNTWLMKQTLVCNMVNGPSSIFIGLFLRKPAVSIPNCLIPWIWIFGLNLSIVAHVSTGFIDTFGDSAFMKDRKRHTL